jgi:ABC transporter substrate binding protein
MRPACLLTSALVAKRLEFIRQLVPESAPISYLMNPQAPESEFHLSYMQAAARDIGQRYMVLNASSEREIDGAFAALAQTRSGALIVSTDPLLVSRFHQIVVLAAYLKIPPFMIGASMLRPGDSSPTEHTSPKHLAKSECMPGKFSKAPSRPPCRSCSQPNSSWLST